MNDTPTRIPGSTYFQHVDGNEMVIYTCLENITLTTTSLGVEKDVYIDTSKDVRVYADTVILRGELVLNAERSFTLFARKIICTEKETFIKSIGINGKSDIAELPAFKKPDQGHDGANKNGYPYLCTENVQDGHDGPHANATAKDGKKGGRGGKVKIYAQQLIFPKDTKGSLHIYVWGGHGETGQRGQDGGNGGKGFYRLYDGLSRNIYQSGYGGKGGNAGYGGKGGDGGDGGSIDICIGGTVNGIIYYNYDGGAAGKQGEAGKPGEGGMHSNNRLGYEDTYRRTHTNRDGSSYESTEKLMRKWEKRKENGNRDPREEGVLKAQDGAFINTPPANATKGAQGYYKGDLDPDLLSSATHLMMMLQRAKAMHIIFAMQIISAPGNAGSDFFNGLADVIDLLNWILERSSWVRVKKNETKAAARSGLELLALKEIAHEAEELLAYAKGNCSPFGESLVNPVVPNLSYLTIDSFLQEDIRLLKDIKAEYDVRASAKDVYENAKGTFDALESTHKATTIILKGRRGDVKKELLAVSADIDAKRKPLQIARQQLISKAEDFQSLVKEFQFPSWDELVNAATMTVFASPLAVVEGLDLWHKGSTEISTDSGDKINKDLIIQKTVTLRDDLEKSLFIGYDSIKKTIDLEGEALMIADLKEYDNMVQKFMRFTTARELHKLIQDFFAIVLQFNNAVIQYNRLLLQIRQIDKDLSSVEQEQAESLSKMSFRNDPAVAYLTAVLAKRYYRALDNCAQKLASLERAYRYTTLEDSSAAFASLFDVNIAWGERYDKFYTLGPQALSECRNELIIAYKGYLGRQTNPPGRYPEQENSPGIKLMLDTDTKGSYSFIGDEQDGYSFEFNIVRTDKECYDADGKRIESNYYIPELADFYDVRLLHDASNGVRLHIQTKDDRIGHISAAIIHSSADSIYDKEGDVLRFKLSSNVPFPIITSPSGVSSELQKFSTAEAAETYRQLGLYAHWTLFFSRTGGSNPFFHPDDIQKMELEFSVTMRAHA